MGEILVDLVPFVIGSAVVPLQIMIVILLLPRSKGLSKAIFFVLGMTAVRLLQGLLFGLILAPSIGESGGRSPVVSTLLLVLGILLLITAYKKWQKEDDPDGEPPKWMSRLEGTTPSKTFRMGALLVFVSGKFWVFTLGAIGVIAEAQLSQASGIAVFLLFILLAQSLLLLAIVIRIVIPAQSNSILESISVWLTRYNRWIVVSISLVFGIFFFVQGVNGLWK